MRTTSLVFMLLALLSCGERTELSQAPMLPVTLDSSFKELLPERRKWKSRANYHPLYIGPYRDTIHVDHALAYSQGNPHPLTGPGSSPEAAACFRPWLDKRSYRTADPSMIVIHVDTSRTIASISHRSRSARKAFPVHLVNRGPDTLEIGYGSFLDVLMEARTEAGGWKPIDERFIYSCGVGVGRIVLPPGYVAVTSAVVQHGDQPTECRIRFGPVVSESFYASIDRRQFESEFDENGNYKEEQ